MKKQEGKEMLRPERNHEIPELTRFVAKEALPDGSIFMTLRDELGPIFEDEDFADLYPSVGQPAESPARLALVTVMQFADNLTDRQAAQAVRERISWKYALGLELTDAGFHYSVLSEFRQRLVTGSAERRLLDKLLEQCASRGLLGGKKKQRTDSTHVLAAIRSLTLLELVGETMRRTLDDVARVAPQWLQAQMQPEWVKRYGRRFDSYRLPKSQEKRLELAVTIGEDGYRLLRAIWQQAAPSEVRSLPMLDILRRIWVQQFYWCDGQVHWRTKKKWGQPPAGKMIASTEDLEARYSVKRSMEWTGYKVHLTETCDQGQPRLITQVETTLATKHDTKVTQTIQEDLAARDLLPETHLVDEGYTEADLLVNSQNRGVELLGPLPSSKSWQDRTEGALDHTQFHIDWAQRVATCPDGKTSARCVARKTWRGTPNLAFHFRAKDCLPCPLRSRCSKAKTGGRTLTIYPQEQYEALQRARERQKTEEFRMLYGERAGIEGTISQSVRKMGLRRSRYLGLSRTHLQHVATAAAINVVRVTNWLAGELPEATRVSPFQTLSTP
jgi:transposase